VINFATSVHVNGVRFAVSGWWSPPVVDLPDPTPRGDVEMHTVQVEDSEVDLSEMINVQWFQDIEAITFNKLCRERR
jgi:hypothetical protein